MNEIKLFAIVVENGSYSDYSKNNLCLVFSEETAETVTNYLNEYTNLLNHFRSHELREFQLVYEKDHPKPIRLQNPKHSFVRPEVPEHLDGMSKKEKQQFPEYQRFLAALKEYDVKVSLFNHEHYAAEKINIDECADWYAAYNEACEIYTTQNLQEYKFPPVYQERFGKFFERACGEATFSWEELELLPV